MVTRSIKSSKQLVCPLVPYHRRGSILIIALWSLCFLATLAVYMGGGVRQKFMFVNRIEKIDKLHFIAEAGAKRAIVELLKQPEKGFSALNENWSNNPGGFKDIKFDNGTFSIYYNYKDERAGSKGIRYGLVDEERKININRIDQHSLRRLFKIILDLSDREAQQLAACIVDWRDEDSLLSIPLGSAEDAFYRSRPHAYAAKNAEFDILDEVLLVKGFDMAVFNQIKDYITIYGSGRININTASREVLLSLGLDREIVDKILFFRYGKDGIPFTEDDNVFKTTSEIVPELSRFFPLSDSQLDQLSAVRDRYLTTDSLNFMLKSQARLDTGGGTAEITAVINRSGKVLYWREF